MAGATRGVNAEGEGVNQSIHDAPLQVRVGAEEGLGLGLAVAGG